MARSLELPPMIASGGGRRSTSASTQSCGLLRRWSACTSGRPAGRRARRSDSDSSGTAVVCAGEGVLVGPDDQVGASSCELLARLADRGDEALPRRRVGGRRRARRFPARPSRTGFGRGHASVDAPRSTTAAGHHRQHRRRQDQQRRAEEPFHDWSVVSGRCQWSVVRRHFVLYSGYCSSWLLLH